MKRVLVFGTFDILHAGHKNFFKQAKFYGDYLIAIIARDKTDLKVKGKIPKNNEFKRATIVAECGLVDKVILGQVRNKYKIINILKPNIICLGYDQNIFTDDLKLKLNEYELNKLKIIRLKPYKPEIYKSSKIKYQDKNKFKIYHKSVGAIIADKDRILMIDRKIYPFSWALPAGHINEGEAPEKVLFREVKEETNLDVKDYKLLFHEFIEWNKCSRRVKGHDWYVYKIKSWEGKAELNDKEEKSISWVKIKNTKNLKLKPVWEYWFKKLKIL